MGVYFRLSIPVASCYFFLCVSLEECVPVTCSLPAMCGLPLCFTLLIWLLLALRVQTVCCWVELAGTLTSVRLTSWLHVLRSHCLERVNSRGRLFQFHVEYEQNPQYTKSIWKRTKLEESYISVSKSALWSEHKVRYIDGLWAVVRRLLRWVPSPLSWEGRCLFYRWWQHRWISTPKRWNWTLVLYCIQNLTQNRSMT